MRRIIELPNNYPTIVTLCGSTRFKSEFDKANYQETIRGNIVLSVSCFNREIDEDQKVMLDILHKQKIDISDEILVIDPYVMCCGKCGKPCYYINDRGTNCCKHLSTQYINYIGDSTKSKIEYAISSGIKVRYLSKEE